MPDIIHVDMDCFFAAVEVKDNPDLAGKPVIVGQGCSRLTSFLERIASVTLLSQACDELDPQIGIGGAIGQSLAIVIVRIRIVGQCIRDIAAKLFAP